MFQLYRDAHWIEGKTISNNAKIKKSQVTSLKRSLGCLLFSRHGFYALRHLYNIGIWHFARGIFQNISNLRIAGEAEIRGVILFVERSGPVLNHHFFEAVHYIHEEKSIECVGVHPGSSRRITGFKISGF